MKSLPAIREAVPAVTPDTGPPEVPQLRWTRREFVARAATVGAALAGAPAAFAAGPQRKLKLGFLGAAHSHFRSKFDVVQQSPDFELVGLCEADEAVRAKGPPGARWLSAEQLLAEAEVVAVESAVKDHARHAAQALRAGRHVHVEKPPADSLAGFRELQRLAEDRNRLLQVGYMWRFNPAINAALEAARIGWLGEVYLVRATMNTLVDADERRKWAGFRGGAMFEQGCHLIDPLVRLLGRPVKVTSFLKHHGAAADALADNTVAVFEFPRALGIVTSAPLQPNAHAHRFFEVLGRNGTARAQPLEPPAFFVDLAKPAGPYAAGRQDVPMPAYQRYVDEFAALAAAIRSGRPLAVSAADELLVQETLLRASEMI
jgi:predicted dehydrogenase